VPAPDDYRGISRMRLTPTHAPVRFQTPELPSMEAIAAYYAAAEEARFYSNGGPCAQLLSARLSAELGDRASVLPVANCTLGLMVALRAALGDPRGCRRLVATPSFTFTATACAIVWAGYEPLFVDVRPDSWQLDPDALAEALRARRGDVAGVLACSTFGSAPPQDVRDGWRAACADHALPLVIDSAAGFGAVDAAGGRLGALGETEVFSFHATKPFAIGEGGAIATADPALAARLSRMVNFGMAAGEAESQFAGLNAKLSELQAATALAMLDRFDDALARRRASAARVDAAIAGCGLRRQAGSQGSTFQAFQVSAPDPDVRDAVLRAAREDDVQARSYFDPPVHRMAAFRAHPRHGDLAVTDALALRALSLPLANDLGDADVARIAAVVRRGSRTRRAAA
jgi:dTDP-4-amino-4,6-dideoxygalactose transaminase